MSNNPFNVTDAGTNGPSPYGEAASADRSQARPTEESDRLLRPAGRYHAEMTRANIMLAVTLAVVVGLIYFLAMRKGPATASAGQQVVETQVDMAILRLNGMPAADAPQAGNISRTLLQNFYNEISSRQVPLKNLQKNPFVFVPPAPAPALQATEPREAAPSPADMQRKSSREEMRQNLNKLRLQSVMMGRGGGTAIISNNLLTVGQTIEGFTVKSIAPNAVVLTWGNEEFLLKMSES